MSFAERVDRQQAAVFRTLGEDAAWSGVADPVRIRCAERDDLDGWGEGQRVVRTRFVRVRRSEVPAPAIGDTVTRASDGVVLEVLAKPRLTRTRVWTCEVKEVQP